MEARFAVIDLLAQYATAVQVADSEAVWSLFADDVDYILDGTIEMRAKGRAEVQGYHAPGKMKGYVRKADGKRTWRGPDTRFRHMMALPVIKLADDLQTAWVTMHFSGVITRFTAVHHDKSAHDGTYILTLRKYGSAWKFQKFVNLTDLAHDPLYHTVEE
jgi:hypothetical protein